MRLWIFVLSGLMSIQTWSWGGLGHWTVSRIADAKISAQTDQEIRKILAPDQDLMNVSTLADSWRYKNTWKHTYDYHFDTIEDGLTYIEQLKKLDNEAIQKGGVTQAILQSFTILKNRSFQSDRLNLPG